MENDKLLKIKYCKNLHDTKKAKLSELNWLKKEIEEEQSKCEHVSVCLGWDGPYQYRDTSFHECLYCREDDPETKYPVIDATNFEAGKYSHGEFKDYREGKMDDLQIIATEMLKADPELTNDDLVTRLKNVINTDIEEYNRHEEALAKLLNK